MALRASMIGRTALFASVLLLLTSVVLEPSPAGLRAQQINAALEQGTIGVLSGEEAAQLYETLRMLTHSAGVDTPVAVNAPFQKGKLNVYVTTAAARDITHCGGGNAVYDPALDAIFVDIAVLQPFKPEAFTRLVSVTRGTKPSAQLVSTYAHFVLLHEIGHRKLHRKIGKPIFDRASTSRKLENEADDFAVRMLFKAYDDYQLPSQVMDSGLYGEAYSSGMSWLNSDELTELGGEWFANRAALDLVMTLQAMTKGMMLDDYAFSPFHSDAAHATFVDRAVSIIRALDRVPKLDPAIVNRRDYMKRVFARFESVAKLRQVQLVAPGGLTMVAFRGQELRAVANVDRGYVIAVGAIEDALSEQAGGSPVAVKLTPLPDVLGTLAPWLQLSRYERGSTFGGSSYTNNEVSSSIGFKDKDYLYKLYQENGPGFAAIAEVWNRVGLSSSTGGDATNYVRWQASRPLRRRHYDDIVAMAKQAAARARTELGIEPLNWSGGRFYFAVRSSQGLIGLLACDADLVCSGFEEVAGGELTFPEKGSPRPRNAELAVLRRGDNTLVFALDEGQQGPARSWRLWRVSASGARRLVASRPFIAEAPPRLTARNGHGLYDDRFDDEAAGQIDGLTPVGESRILIRLRNDSCFLYDDRTAKVRLVFHPCDRDLEFAAHANGMIAVYRPQGRKIFLIDGKAVAE